MIGAESGRRDGILAGALALQRVLALEGRNALARVELAASELLQWEARPSARDRLAAIRDAVGALDDVLDKIERLADPQRPGEPLGATPLEPVWRLVAERIAPALAARGVALEDAGGWPGAHVALPAAALERLLLSLVRVAVAGVGDAEPDAADGPIRLRVEVREEDGSLVLSASVADGQGERRFALERADRVELEVALAGSGGGLVDESSAATSRIGLRLPRVVRDA